MGSAFKEWAEELEQRFESSRTAVAERLEDRAEPQTETEVGLPIDPDNLERCIGCGKRAVAILNRYSACPCHDDVRYGICGECKYTPRAEKAIEEKMMLANIARLGARRRVKLIAQKLRENREHGNLEQ